MFGARPSTVVGVAPAPSSEAAMNESHVVTASPSASSTPSYDAADLRQALGLAAGAPCNIGALLSNRWCELGHGGRKALIWENHTGQRRDFTFDDLRRHSDA